MQSAKEKAFGEFILIYQPNFCLNFISSFRLKIAAVVLATNTVTKICIIKIARLLLAKLIDHKLRFTAFKWLDLLITRESMLGKNYNW